MNYKERFQEIHDFLLPYQNVWQNEIMLLYPDPFKDYNLEWINELASFRDKNDVIKLEKKEVQNYLKSDSLIRFYDRIEQLCHIHSAPDLAPMPSDQFTFLFMIPKKQHEIKKLAPFVNDFYQKNKVERIIDIGGGIGLLSQTLNKEYNLKITSVDMDAVLQKTGQDRHEKNARHPENKIEYLNLRVDADNLAFGNILLSNHITLGLHTCGSLANDQMKASVKKKIKGMINFGCCYHKLEKDPQGQNISKFAQGLKEKIEMNHFALTLASRAHRKMDEKDYDLKLKVKLYRYAIHFLLHDHYGFRELVTLGNSSPKLYDESFGTYVLEQLARIQVLPKHTKEELDAYFEDTERQNLIWKMLAAGLIRNALGRLLELYILLDRAIFLEENGYTVDMMEFFQEEISPRNIGLIASLP
ncbi:MAG: methyltransferase [Bacteriovoracaceae bacterium]